MESLGNPVWLRRKACGHSITPDPREFAHQHHLDMKTPLLSIAKRLKCTHCNEREAHCWPEPYGIELPYSFSMLIGQCLDLARRVYPLGLIRKYRTVRRRCPVYPRKRTFSEAAPMSAKCQKRTFAVERAPGSACAASMDVCVRAINDV